MPDLSSACFRELRNRRLVPDSVLAVYLAGSIVRGWGNDSSDLDVYLITTDRWNGTAVQHIPVPLKPDSVPLVIEFVDGRRWEMSYWTESQVDQMLAMVSADTYQGGSGDLTVQVQAFLERLTYAEPVLGPDWLARRRAEVQSSALRSMVVAMQLDSLDNQSEDAIGMLAANDLDSAVLAARNAFGFAVDALLASHGEFGYGTKWRARRMRAKQPPELSFKDYWSLETMRTFDPSAPRVWVQEVLTACQDITMEISL